MKTLVDEIRDMVELSTINDQHPTVHADAIIGHLCVSRGDERELLTTIADRIEREYMEVPRFEDGEPVKVGDMVLWNDNEAKRVDRILVDVYLEGSCGTYNNVLKRPEHEVLDADGVPIKVGDHVWWKDGREFVITAVRSGVKAPWEDDDKLRDVVCTEAVEHAPGRCSGHGNADSKEFTHRQPVLDVDGVPIKVGDVVYFVDNAEAFDVLGVESDGDEPVHIGRNDGTSTDAWVYPGELTHKQPDTLERIEADAKKSYEDYWGCAFLKCYDCPALVDGKRPCERYATSECCIKAQTLDLLRRQREVLERGQE